MQSNSIFHEFWHLIADNIPDSIKVNMLIEFRHQFYSEKTGKGSEGP